jgi:hypothetical protein
MTSPSVRMVGVVGSALLVVLGARSVAYALTPGPTARVLEHRAGGPALPVVIAVALGLAACAAITVCYLVSLAVRERALLERRDAPRFPVGRMVGLALLLALVTTVGGGFFEAYVHWREGLGWHGLDCLAGPVHRNLVPIECALSLVAASLLAAADHVARWMRRTFASLRALPPRLPLRAAVLDLARADPPRAFRRIVSGGPRAPPAFS